MTVVSENSPRSTNADPVTSETGGAKPNFFIVGAPKCGTTAWAHYLASHPEIYFPSAKEPHFFNTDQPNFRWAQSEEEYAGYFANCGNEKIVSEASVQYLYSSSAARHISEYNSSAKILVMLRKPSEFIRSYHNQLLMNCDESIEDLRSAWDLSGSRTEGAIPPQNRAASFLNYKKVGLFSEQIARYLEHFDRSQIMVVFMEDWTKDPRALYVRLMAFLGVPDDGRTTFPPVHTAKTVSSQSLHRVTQRPPSALKAVTKMIRRIPGLQGFKAGALLRNMNVREGYRATAVDVALAKEIDAYFANDQERLQKMLSSELFEC